MYNLTLPSVICRLVDGGLSDWKNSTDCSKSCGNGTLNQIRHCDSPKPQHGGASCTGKTTRTVECNTQACPGKLTSIFFKVTHLS